MNPTKNYQVHPVNEEKKDENTGAKMVIFMVLTLIFFVITCIYANKSDPSCLQSDPAGTVTTYLFAMAFIYAGYFCVIPVTFLIMLGTHGNDNLTGFIFNLFCWSLRIISLVMLFFGGFILFRSNSDCLTQGNAKTRFALALWIMELLGFIMQLKIQVDIKC